MMAITTEQREMKKMLRQKTAMPLLWIGMVSIVMLFAALTSAVIVSKGSREWVEFKLPETFLYSTITLVISSFTYILAYRSAKKNMPGALKLWVLVTFLLGLLFAVLQFVSWGHLTDQGIFFALALQKKALGI